MITIVIGLMGPAGAGKSSIANYLAEKYGAERYSLAGPLKQFAKNALEFSDEQLYGTQAQKEAPDPRYGGKSCRWFLQRLGTEGGRKTFGEDFWTKQCLGQIQREAPALAVIDDVRFVSEALAVRGLWEATTRGYDGCDGKIWRLESPDRETSDDGTHASEREWKDAPYDFLIKPLERGLPQLFQLADDGARHAKLFPKRPEVAL